MLLSIVVPMYNCERFIEDTISSIGNIDQGEVEVILIDDGSTDNTFGICSNLISGNKAYKLIRNTNHGVSYTRNFGINMVSGEYILFLDSDDKMARGWLETIKRVLAKIPGQDIYLFSKKVNKSNPSKDELVRELIGVSKLNKECCLSSPWSKIYKTEIIKNHHIYFDERIIHGEDALFNLEVIMNSESINLIDESIYLYRINTLSVTHKYDSRFLDSNSDYINKLYQLLSDYYGEQHSLIKEAVKFAFENSVYIFSGKVSKIENISEIIVAVRDFYSREFYISRIKSYGISKSLGTKEKILYLVAKSRLLLLFELTIYLFRNNKKSYVEKLVSI